MARPSLILDASVGVKWFYAKGEASLQQAISIRNAHITQQLSVGVPDLFYYEVANAIVNKKSVPTDDIQGVVVALFALRLQTDSINIELLADSIRLSRQVKITIYDACYVALARKYDCPLVTANPRHQKEGLGCRIIPIEEWQPGLT